MKTALVPAVLAFASVAFAAGTDDTERLPADNEAVLSQMMEAMQIEAMQLPIDEPRLQPANACQRIPSPDPMAAVTDLRPPTVVRM